MKNRFLLPTFSIMKPAKVARSASLFALAVLSPLSGIYGEEKCEWQARRGIESPNGNVSEHGLGFGVELDVKQGWPSLIAKQMWGRDIPLGMVSVPEAEDIEPVSVLSGWDGIELALEYKDPMAAALGDATASLKCLVSRIVPAVLVETDSAALSFFRGSANMPGNIAFCSKNGIEIKSFGPGSGLEIDLDMAEPWLLAWRGKEAKGLRSTLPVWREDEPITFHMPWESALKALNSFPPARVAPADPAVLFVFGNTPETLTGVGELGFDFGGMEAGGVAVVLLDGGLPRFSEEAAGWHKLPEDVVAQCRAWTRTLGFFPTAVVECYSHDASAGATAIELKFEFHCITPDAKPCAPVPPMLALAFSRGFPLHFLDASGGNIEPLPPLADTFAGPCVFLDGTAGYSIVFKGLDRYVHLKRELGAWRAGYERINELLSREVGKMIGAGPLAPWYAIASTDFPDATHDQLEWALPGDPLVCLAEVMPLLPGELAESAGKYMARHRREFPPETVAHLPVAGLPRRERGLCAIETHEAYYSTHGSMSAGKSFASLAERVQDDVNALNWHIRCGLIPLENFYALARYYECAGESEVLPPESWDKLNDGMEKYLENSNWATMGWNVGKWPRLSKARYWDDRTRYQGWGGVLMANRYFAATLGMARLAARRGDTDAYGIARGLFAKAAALRFGLGRFPRYLYESGALVLPKDSSWQVRFLQSNCQHTGRFYVPDFDDPAKDPRSLLHLSEAKASLSDGSFYVVPAFLPFRGITPELGLFARDYLREEAEVFMRAVRRNSPDWFMAWGDQQLGAETHWRNAWDAYQCFLVLAWVLDEPPGNLEKYLDVPWVERGDLFYIHKLAELARLQRDK